MGAADEEAGVPRLGELFDGFAGVLPDAADDPVRKKVDGSEDREKMGSIYKIKKCLAGVW